MSKSRNRACLYVPWSRANVIASAAYKQFSSLVEKGKMRCENSQRPLGSYNSTSQSNWFACLKNYHPINARGSDPDPVVCMKMKFEAKVTRGFSLFTRRFRDSLSPLRGLLLISFAKKNQEKPLDQGSIIASLLTLSQVFDNYVHFNKRHSSKSLRDTENYN